MRADDLIKRPVRVSQRDVLSDSFWRDVSQRDVLSDSFWRGRDAEGLSF